MSKRAIVIGTAVFVVIVLLAGGAYTAVQLLTAQENPNLPAGAQVLEDGFDDGSGNLITVRTILLPAPELPTDKFAAEGIFLRQEDNSYYVGTGDSSVNINLGSDTPELFVGHSGPEVEVVVSRDTIFYEDITDVGLASESSESKEQTLQQVIRQVEPPTDLQRGSSLMVWGERRGDRVVATILLFVEGR
ncbi:hypothetical protein [Candidatus Leptofilum sp.]|uniref:hypothetical protein n=1 Tax=Candidatus Leptofilum sp. TaxID=3241576 RepID=UPI003B5AA08E